MSDRLAPHAVHAPTELIEERNKTYAPQVGPPAGNDQQGPFWWRFEIGRRAGLLACPDCTRGMVGAHDDEVARVGFNFLVCASLGHQFKLRADILPCHEGCAIACGRLPAEYQ